MDTDAVTALYNRFVSAKEKTQKLVVVDDTDLGAETMDHLNSPWIHEVMKECWPHYMLAGKTIKVPLSKTGPTLLIYWRCREPKITSLENGFEVEIPYGRLAALYRGDDGKLVLNVYYAWGY